KTLGISTQKPRSESLLATPILAGRMPQMSVRKITPGKSAMSSGLRNSASMPPGISTFVSIILVLIDHGVPVTRLMDSGADKTTFAQMPPDHPVEIAMGDERADAGLFRARDQNVGRAGGALARLARIFNFGMKARMPQDARHHRPFGHRHAQE